MVGRRAVLRVGSLVGLWVVLKAGMRVE